MRKIFFLILALLLLAGPATASEVLVVQSLRSPLYDEAIRGFKGACAVSTRTLVLSDYADAELARVIREERPRLVLAVGDRALAALRKIRKTPVIALMALSITNPEVSSATLSGVSLFVSPERYLSLFQKIKAKRIGIVHDPARSGWYLKLARAEAERLGMELVVREVHNPRQTMSQLDSLKGKVDSLWVLPDTTAVTNETLEAYFLFSQRETIPVISFSASHLKLGAMIALEIDRGEMGKQAGEITQKLLQGAEPGDRAVVSPRKVFIKSNDAVMRRFNYSANLTSKE